MLEFAAQTFALDVPAQFEDTRLFLETFRAETFRCEYVLQNPEFNVALVARADFTDREGDSFIERMLNAIEDFGEGLERLERCDMVLGGTPAAVLEGRILWRFGGKETVVHYFVGAVDRGEFGYLMKAYCEMDQVETFRPLFLGMWSSLRFLGDGLAAIAARDAALKQAALGEQEQEQEQEQSSVPLPLPSGSTTPSFQFASCPLQLVNPPRAHIAQGTRRLQIVLAARWEPGSQKSPYVAAEHGQPFGFEISFRGVHGEAGPQCQVKLKDGRCIEAEALREQRCEVSMLGAHPSANFTGDLLLQSGQLRMAGAISVSYERSWKKAPVTLAVLVDFRQVDWSEYEFTSLNETQGCAVEEVRHLSMPDAPFQHFPERLLDLSALEELALQRPMWPGLACEPAPLLELPDLARYPNLRRLHISGTRLRGIPESIGKLQRLNSLAVNHSQLTTVPSEVFALPELHFLFLRNNGLTTLPALSAPPKALRTLALGGNRLTHLPEVFIQGPELCHLYLEDNPWESLPESSLSVEQLRLPYADRLRLFDMSYHGADGEGTVPWDDEQFYTRSLPESRLRFLEAVRAAGAPDAAQALLHLAKCAVRLTHGAQDTYFRRGNTRFGGLPDLPAELSYPHTDSEEPTGYQFIAQLDCAALAALQSYLPRTGFLYFFVDNLESLTPRVLFWDGPRESLRRGPEVEVSYGKYADHAAPYQAYEALITPSISLPSTFGYGNDYYFEGGAEPLQNDDTALQGLLELDAFSLQRHHDINAYVFTQHEGPELQAATEKRGEPREWMVLLKVASLDDFQWWDAGEIFFVIHKSDLEKRDFSNVYCGLESS